MNVKRKQRLQVILFSMTALAVALYAIFTAFEQNMNIFYPPHEVKNGLAPVGKNIRIGGMVLNGSVKRGNNDLSVSFILSDLQGNDVSVSYSGILPDLFREGQGIVAEGILDLDGEFLANTVLAKHDENYMPPELSDLAIAADQKAALNHKKIKDDEIAAKKRKQEVREAGGRAGITKRQQAGNRQLSTGGKGKMKMLE